MAIRGVVGTGEGQRGRKPCIVVLVVDSAPDLARKIPAVLEGYSIRIEVSGEIRPRGKSALK